MVCHYEAAGSEVCPWSDEVEGNVDDEYKLGMMDYDGARGVEGFAECPLDPQDALSLFNSGDVNCEADAKIFMEAYKVDYQYGGSKECDAPNGGCDGTDAFDRPAGTSEHLNNCLAYLDVYTIVCEGAVTTEAEGTTAAPTTPVGGEDCKPLDEAGCAAQPDSCRATSRGGKFRKCKPKRCKPMTESECETAVHCEKKMGRRGDYKKCRSID